MKFRFDAMLCSKLSNKISDAGHLKYLRWPYLACGPQVPHLYHRKIVVCCDKLMQL